MARGWGERLVWRGFLENQTIAFGSLDAVGRFDQRHVRRCVSGPLLERVLRLARVRRLLLSDITSTFSDANVGLTLNVPLMGDRLRVTPAINCSKALDKALFDDHLYWASFSVH